jgi:gliding motility-associated-like protein
VNNEDKYIQDLFGEKLHHAEAPVDPAIWQGISNALPAAGAVAGTSSAAFQMGTLGWVATGLVALAIAVTTIVLQTPTPDLEVAAVEQILESKTVVPPKAEEEIPESKVSADDMEEAEATVQKETKPIVTAQKPETKVAAPELTRVVPAESSETPAVQMGDETEAASESEDESVANLPEEKQQNPNLTADFEVSEDLFEELNYRFIPAFIEANNYQWDFGDGSFSQEAQPNHMYVNEGNFTITLTTRDDNGFEKHREHQLNVSFPSLLVLPNTFTPDNNGTNDFLLPAVQAKNVKILKMMVFSTKGELLFEQDDDGAGWDGNYSDGTAAPKGDYVLIVKAINASNENITKQRKVLLQRN